MPFNAAFSLSTRMRYFGWSSSTYQSTSTTPSVRFHRSRICLRDSDAVLLIRAVDLGDQGLQHRRTGRHLRDFDARAQTVGDWAAGAAALAWRSRGSAFALALAEQVDLNVGDVRTPAQIVVPHQAVEVERRCRANVGLEVDHFGLAERCSRPARRQRARFLPAWCRWACPRSPEIRSCCRRAASSP